jgi:hypothetical protein
MQDAPFGRQAAFSPHLLDVDERALTWAKHVVLQSRKHDQVFFGEWHFLF